MATFCAAPAGAAASAGIDLDRGAAVYKLCAACHGSDGAGNHKRLAPAIAGLPAWYTETQIRNFQKGLRAYDPTDSAGLQMRPMSRSLTTDADVRAVAAYIETLSPAAPPPASVTGDAKRGQGLYATCAACHGPSGKGNAALKAPPLVSQSDWYLVGQIEKYRSGMRGAKEGDSAGAQMRAMAGTLPDDQAVKDVAVYIGTLRK